MSNENRSATIAKLVKVAKKYYPVVKPPVGRSVIEHLLYACLLENGDFSAADEAFARLEQYSDWNEVRVSTTQELSEAAAGLSEPTAAIERLKTALHSIFETHYVYELDFLLKENQGKVIAQLEKYKGVTPFVISYLVQNCFAGHKIPVGEATLHLADVLGLVTPKEREASNVPGLERAVPKTKGAEFFSTMHQFAIAFQNSPHDKVLAARLKEVSADAFKRLAAQAAEDSKPTPKSGKKSGTDRGTGNGKPAAVDNGSAATKAAAAAKKSDSKGSEHKSKGAKSQGDKKSLPNPAEPGPAEPGALESGKSAGSSSPKGSSKPMPPAKSATGKAKPPGASGASKGGSSKTAVKKKPR